MKERNIYQDAIDKWGTSAQLDQMVEEMAELTLAISKKQIKTGLLQSDKNVITGGCGETHSALLVGV